MRQGGQRCNGKSREIRESPTPLVSHFGEVGLWPQFRRVPVACFAYADGVRVETDGLEEFLRLDAVAELS